MDRTFRNRLALLVGLFGLATVPALAQTTIYATGFENPPFADGSKLVGQDGWAAPDFLSPDAALVSTSAAHTGTQGVQVNGQDMVGNDIVTSLGYGAVGSYRRPVNFAVNGGATIVSSAVCLNGPQSFGGPAVFFGASVASRLFGPNGGDTYEFQLSSEGLFAAFDDNLSTGIGDPGVFTPVPAELGRWYNMAIVSDFNAQTVTFVLDGKALGSAPFSDTFDTLLRGALVVYASPEMADFTRNDYTAKFDNFAIVAVPEPGVVAFGVISGLSVLGLIVRRKRVVG